MYLFASNPVLKIFYFKFIWEIFERWDTNKSNFIPNKFFCFGVDTNKLLQCLQTNSIAFFKAQMHGQIAFYRLMFMKNKFKIIENMTKITLEDK